MKAEMDIQKDAGELLAYIYTRYTQGLLTQRADIENETNWDTGRTDRAIDYLDKSGLINMFKYLGDVNSSSYGFRIRALTPKGINIIENKESFKSTFGFKIGIPGLFTFSWHRRQE
jgi:hypothetical protein